MNVKERYRSAFDAVSDDLQFDPGHRTYKYSMSLPARIMTVICIICLSFAGAYAADEEFRNEFTIWIQGEGTSMHVTPVDDLTYEIGFTKPDGEEITAEACTDVPRDAEYIAEIYNNLAVTEKDSRGRFMFYYKNHKIDITDRFREFGAVTEIDGHEWILADYCYLECDGLYCTIVRWVCEEEGIDRCSTSASQSPVYGGTFGGLSLPSYEEYTND